MVVAAGLALACGGGGGAGNQGGENPSAHEAADQCDDGVDNDDDGFVDCDDLDCRAESSDCELAPALDRSIVSNLHETSRFLYTGPDPVQKRLDEDALDFWRVSVLHGRVVDAEGEPLRDVRVSVKDHPQYGFSETRFDGRYDLVVNGGGVLVLDFEHPGHIPVQRSVPTKWQREHVVPELGLVPLSNEVHTVKIGSSKAVRAEPADDGYGKRQPFLVFPDFIEAEAVLPDGSTQPLDELQLRVTQYPFQPETPTAPGSTARFAPGSLPAGAGLSHSVEVTVEEAEELRATQVRFSEPVAYYVENFLNLPTGSSVPLRSYDSQNAEWESMGTGVVIEIIDIQSGLAQLDIDGDGEVDDPDDLEDLGVQRAEREELAARFEAGDTLWRNQVTHFSTLTHIWDIVSGGSPAPGDLPFQLKQNVDEPFFRGKVLVDELVTRESVDLAGTPYSLVYQGNRSHGHSAAFHVQIPLVGDTVPAGLTQVFLVADIGGRLFPEDPAERSFEPEPGLTHDFLWDGRNSFGQLLQGEQVAQVWIGYAFEGVSLGGLEAVTPEEVQDAIPFSLPGNVIWSWQNVLLGMLDAQGFQFGGFGIDAHHAFDPVRNILYYGDGRQRTANGLHLQIIALDEPRQNNGSDLGESLRELDAPDSMAVADDGSVFVSDDGEEARIWRIAPSGDKEVVLGPGAPGAAGDVELLGPQGVAIDPLDGTLFVTDWEGLKVLFLRPNGEVGVLLGDDPDAVIQEPLTDPDGLAVGPNRELYVSDANRVLKVNVSAGQIENPRYLGGVDSDASVDLLPVMAAEEVPLEQASGLAVDLATGTVYVASRFTHQVWRVEPNGEAFLHAGTGEPGFSGDGALAVDAQLEGPRGLALGKDGSLFISDQENFRIRRVFPSGEITTVAGGGEDFPSSVTPGPDALVSRPDGLAFGPDGSLFAGGGEFETEPAHLFRISPEITGVIGTTDFIVPSDDGQLAYRFDQNGRHLETIDVMTGVSKFTFLYDEDNLLSEIRDTFDVTTTIERNGIGEATQIEGEFGHVNELEYNERGHMTSVSAVVDAVAGTRRECRFEYDSNSGLLSMAEGGEGDRTLYTFDELGRIDSVTNAAGVVEVYDRQELLTAQRVSVEIEGAEGEDIYDRMLLTAELFDGFSVSDRDQHASSGTALLNRTFSSALAGGISVAGVTAASNQWGEQTRFPSEVTLVTREGRQLSQTLSVSASGLASAPSGAVANPLDFNVHETTVTLNGVQYRRTYERSTRTLTDVSPAGRTTTTIFNELGLPERLQIPGVADRVYQYDDSGRIERVTQEADAQSRVTRYEYGADGEVESLIDPLGQTTSFRHDGVGRTTRVTRDDGAITAYGYDANDNLTSITPPERPEHEFSYDEAARLADYFPPEVDDPAGADLLEGQIHYDFDEFSRLTGVLLAGGASIEHHYFQDFYRPSQLWITPRSGADEEVFYLTYDEGDRDLLESVYGPRNGLVFEYDAPLLKSLEFQTESASGRIRFEYDEFFRVSEMHLVGSDPVEYRYDDDSLLVQAGPLSVTRDPGNGLITDTVVSGLTTTETSTGFGELRGHAAAFEAAELFSQSFERDELGRITSLTEFNQGTTTTTTYTYDTAGRLASATVDANTTDYFYDANDNRFPDAALALASYDNQDRIESFGDFVFESTPAGDVLRRSNADQTAGYELVYGPRGELTRATVLGTGATVTYEVDPFGRRVGRRVNGGAPKGWLYSDQLKVIAEVDNNAARTDFIYGTRENVPDLMFKYGTTFYRFVTDHLGSVRLVVNVETGEVVQELAYDPWGKVILDTNPGFQPFGFAGGLYDPATGLVRFGARDYDPELGRWTSRDPILFNGGQTNLYAYVGNNPVNYIDPTGLEANEKECADLLKKIENIKKEIDKRIGELHEDKLNLPETHPRDNVKGSLSRRGHRRMINEHKRNLAKRQAEWLTKCGPPPGGVPEPEKNWLDWEYWEEVTGLTGAALLLYLIISEGSRLIPVRNLVPVP